MAINYVRRGGTLMIYGVYDNAALVHWSPSKIFLDEIRVGHVFLKLLAPSLTLILGHTGASSDYRLICTNTLLSEGRRVP